MREVNEELLKEEKRKDAEAIIAQEKKLIDRVTPIVVLILEVMQTLIVTILIMLFFKAYIPEFISGTSVFLILLIADTFSSWSGYSILQKHKIVTLEDEINSRLVNLIVKDELRPKEFLFLKNMVMKSKKQNILMNILVRMVQFIYDISFATLLFYVATHNLKGSISVALIANLLFLIIFYTFKIKNSQSSKSDIKTFEMHSKIVYGDREIFLEKLDFFEHIVDRDFADIVDMNRKTRYLNQLKQK